MSRTRTSAFDAPVRCRICGGEHVVHGIAELLRQPIAFGGAPRPTGSATAGWAGPVTCPRESRSFEGELFIPAEFNESVRRVQIESVTDAHVDGRPGGEAAQAMHGVPRAVAQATGTGPDWIDDELSDWRKNTVATQRSYATTMLTTSSGAVAVYFAVLKYLGWEQAHLGAGLVALTIAAPVLLFAAAASFALALRPSLTFVERSEYAEFRERRVNQMHRLATAATVLYVTALVLAVVTFIAVLEASR